MNINRSEVLQPDTYIDEKGILCKADTKKKKSKPFHYDSLELVQSPYADIPIPVRAANMPQSVWDRIVQSYNSTVTNRIQADVVATNAQRVEATRVAAEQEAIRIQQQQQAEAAAAQQAAAQQAAIAEQNISVNKEASEAAIQAVQPELDDTTKAVQEFFKTDENLKIAQDNLKEAGMYATPQNHQAVVNAAIENVQAISNATDNGAVFPPTIQTEAAETAAAAINNAIDSGVNVIPPVVEKILPVIEKVQAEGEQTNTNATGKTETPINVAPTVVQNVGLFEQLVNFIYKSLYKD
jgi:hypothetical protein